eukprot:7836376-Ditylum_brightwellii.AAC.2
MTIQDVRQFLVTNKDLEATINKYNSPISDSATSDGSEDNIDTTDFESKSSESEEQEDEVEDKETLVLAEKKGNKESTDKDLYTGDRPTKNTQSLGVSR